MFEGYRLISATAFSRLPIFPLSVFMWTTITRCCSTYINTRTGMATMFLLELFHTLVEPRDERVDVWPGDADGCGHSKIGRRVGIMVRPEVDKLHTTHWRHLACPRNHPVTQNSIFTLVVSTGYNQSVTDCGSQRRQCSCYSTKTHVNSMILIFKLNLTSLRNIYIKSGLCWAPHTFYCICFLTKSNSICG